MEMEVATLTRDAGDRVVKLVLKTILEQTDFEERCLKPARQENCVKLRSGARRGVEVTLKGRQQNEIDCWLSAF